MSAPIRATVEVPADVQFLRVITACLEQVLQKQTSPVPPALGQDLELALQETCVNVMVHAYDGMPPGTLAVAFELRPDQLSMVVTDRGRPFDPGFVSPDLEAGRVHGYGLFLVRALLDDVVYVRDGDVNRWTLLKTLP